MRVLVTGASGLIGAALCDALLERGDEVVGLTRNPARARVHQHRIEWKAWEPTLERPDAAHFAGVEAVVHLLGESIAQRWTEDAKRRIMESRRTGTHNLAQAIEALPEAARPRVMVSQSAVGYYGDRGAALDTETDAPGAGFDSEVARAWEAAAHEVEAAGVRLVILRTGHVLSARGGLLGELLTPFKLGVGGPLAGGRQYMPWIHIEDEVGVILWVLGDERVSGVLNSTSPNPVTNAELSKALGRALHRPAVVPVPGFVLDLKFGGEFGQVLRGGQRVLPKRAEELGHVFRFSEIDEALADLL